MINTGGFHFFFFSGEIYLYLNETESFEIRFLTEKCVWVSSYIERQRDQSAFTIDFILMLFYDFSFANDHNEMFTFIVNVFIVISFSWSSKKTRRPHHVCKTQTDI